MTISETITKIRGEKGKLEVELIGLLTEKFRKFKQDSGLSIKGIEVNFTGSTDNIDDIILRVEEI